MKTFAQQYFAREIKYLDILNIKNTEKSEISFSLILTFIKYVTNFG